MKKLLCFALCFLTFAFIVAGCNPNKAGAGSGDIVIGSKYFTEQVILGELIAQQIEAKTGLKVGRKLNLGGTGICHEGIKSGQLDAYVEYTGTAFTSILKQKTISDPKAVYKQVKRAVCQSIWAGSN